MNKQERKLKGFHKFKKRLQNFGYKIEDVNRPDFNLHAFKTTGKPCSCWMCKGEKFDRKEKHKNKLDE